MTATGVHLRLSRGLVAAILLAVALSAIGVGVALISDIGERIIDQRQRDVAEAARDYFVTFAEDEGLAAAGRALDRHERTTETGFRYALYGKDGQLLGGARLLSAGSLPPPGYSRMSIVEDGSSSPWQVLVQPIDEVGGTLVVYEDLGERSAFQTALVIGCGLALATAIAAVTLASLLLSRLLYRRAESIERTARRVAGGELSARTPADPDGDVFDRLGVAVNAMLDSNEELLAGMRTVTDSLAHDLRSPLTRLKGALSRALEADISEAERNEAIAQAWEEADNTLATTSALLDIARAETGLSRTLFEPVDLTFLVEETAELFGPVVEDAGQSLSVSVPASPVVAAGHELLLRQAIGNLLFNAARYAGPGAEVSISLEDGPGQVCIVVADTGPGIGADHRGRVQERFVRLDEARSTPGSGLGLAIAAACAKLHRGRLVLDDNQPGLKVSLELSRLT
ncbi:MAG: hypothetical protein JWM33_3567 [Caulobacteraceae bacterium]|nr:hypothetical protein [Caulobacteraceae bacterium]